MPPKYLLLLALIGQGARTFRELDAAIGATPTYSTARVSWYLNRLRAAGLIRWKPKTARSIELTDAGKEAACGLLLSRHGERVTGVWRVNREATERATYPLIDQAEFDRVTDYIFTKNDELYRRLAEND